MTRHWPWQPPIETGVVDPAWTWIEQRWQDAIDKAIGYYRAGRPGRGDYELTRAALAIARRLEDVATVEQLDDLVLIEPCKPRPALTPIPGGA